MREKPLQPGSLNYAKEALRRASTASLDGITGLTIPNSGQITTSEVDLATGNYYGLYITPGSTDLSAANIKKLSQILFSIQDANAGSKLAQVSMGTGYFAFDDFKDGIPDYNEFIARLTPRMESSMQAVLG